MPHLDSGGAYHVGDANTIDSSLDWSDASRFPLKYAAWKEQMPLKEVRISECLGSELTT